MKLLRHGIQGAEKPGLLAGDGTLRDLSGLLADLGPDQLALGALAALRAIDPMRLPVVEGTPRLGPPIAGTRKFIAIGLNYHDHAEESGQSVPNEPVVFSKWTSCIGGPNDDIVPPPGSTMLDWEVELGIVIGSTARSVGEADALAHVAGYCVVNDVSERHFQLKRDGGQWDKGKGFDSFGPVGPWLVTSDEVGDPQSLDLWLKVNGKTMQNGTTSKMIFSCARLVSYCSGLMTLEPGDIIATGTPAGVGLGMKPPVFLQPGDVVELGIRGLGTQRQQVARRSAPNA
ncbi:fumarylacetoacetate hydrolase family protein [Aquabacterium sp. J223]|uniref:fumarylacetoacetate hydrolase family protein n=1 Tax=Aquabacterium sp. J223 TaxID=2898431 RepID=UPI0021ADA0B6|nr:fumarylacetoacetate hydrolase family protein [Aquabacterium sp. J223]UUX93996.1 fumarylacetoacetate hydrolase family protein [Aquabacterium sp. J223]